MSVPRTTAPSRPTTTVRTMHAMAPVALVLRAALACALGLAAAPPVAHAQWQADGAPVCTAAGDQGDLAIVSDGGGGAIVAWTDARTTPSRVYVARLDASGRLVPGWTADGVPVTALPGAGPQSQPSLVGDGAGGAIVAWVDARRDPAGDLYVTRLLRSGTRAAGWPDTGLALCAITGSQDRPVGVTDGVGGAYFAWQDGRGAAPTVVLTRVAGNGTFPSGWSAQQGGLTLEGYDPAVVTDGAGGAIVTWADKLNVYQSDDDIRAIRFLPDGTRAPGWTARYGLVVCEYPGPQDAVAAVPDGTGGAIFAWLDLRAGNGDVYAQRITGAGARAWDVVGVPLCTTEDEQGPPLLAPDGAGGAIAVFEDLRDIFTLPDLYGQHVTATGTLSGGWPADGLAVANAAGGQESPGLVPDGAGGMLLAWSDSRTFPRDIRALRRTGAGAPAPGWAADGTVVCGAAGDQTFPVVCGDGSGGAIVAWVDERSGQRDVYAQRVTAAGAVGPTVGVEAPGEGAGGGGGAIGAGLTLSAPRPVPAPGTVRCTFELVRAATVRAAVFDAAGRRVRTLLAEGPQAAGAHGLAWDGLDDRGQAAPPGVYLLRVEADAQEASRRLVRL